MASNPLDNLRANHYAAMRGLTAGVGRIYIKWFFSENWRAQGFIDRGVEPWRPRKKETKKTKGKQILIGTGRLRKSGQIIRMNPGVSVTVGTVIPYAKYINSGTPKMVARPFVKDSYRANEEAKRYIQTQLANALNK